MQASCLSPEFGAIVVVFFVYTQKCLVKKITVNFQMSQNSLKTNNIDSKCQGIPRRKIRDDKNVKATRSG